MDSVTEHPVQWAVEQLRDQLKARRIPVQQLSSLDQAPANTTIVVVTSHTSKTALSVLDEAKLTLPNVPEALAIINGMSGDRPVLLVTGFDVRGLVYGLLELADRVLYSKDPVSELERPDRIIEQPANRIRSIARLFTSVVEDKSWYYNKSFWNEYLSMLIYQRINRFTLTLGVGYNRPSSAIETYFYFSYPFLLDVPGYNVRAVGLSNTERDRNLDLLKYIAGETTRRGLHFQLALWNHGYEFKDSPDVNYTISGLTRENHAAYCHDALYKLIRTVPEIDGITFRCHSESGISEGSWEFWRKIYNAVTLAASDGKKRIIDIHSKGISHELIDIALETGMPVTVGPKYWAEHQGLPYHQSAIMAREWEKALPREDSLERLRRFTRYGYADYLREDRRYGVMFRIWPGTQRLLLRGDPAMAAGYSRYSHICDSDGVEWFEPLSFKGRMGSGLQGTRDGYADVSLHPDGGSWVKYLYTYRIWGRMLYNPDTPREVWSRYLKSEFGRAARDCEIALGHASRVFLLITTTHLPSASNNGYWPEMDTPDPIVEGNRFIHTTGIDPGLFTSPDQFADELVSGKQSGKYSPIEVAQWLDDLASITETHLSHARHKIADHLNPVFRRLDIDATIQAGNARFFAEKNRAAVAYAFYQKTGDHTAIQEALKQYRSARETWASFSSLAKGVYVENVAFGLSSALHGHWFDRLESIDKDLAEMETLASKKTIPEKYGSHAPTWKEANSHPGFLPFPLQSRPQCHHQPPSNIQGGYPLTLQLTIETGFTLSKIHIHYRHLNQSEAYEIIEMSQRNGHFQATIPGEYTNSPYPLLYYFELFDPKGRAWIYPGFNPGLANQPYIILQHA